MEFTELIERRHSVRAYDKRPVENDRLLRVLEAGLMAPTSGNKQAFKIMVIHTRGEEIKLKTIAKRDWFVAAPLLLCVVNDREHARVRVDGMNFGPIDAASVMSYLMLAAANEGLGTCWVGDFHLEAARKVLKLPAGKDPVAFTPLGYPHENEGAGIRMVPKVDDYVIFEDWKEQDRD